MHISEESDDLPVFTDATGTAGTTGSSVPPAVSDATALPAWTVPPCAQDWQALKGLPHGHLGPDAPPDWDDDPPDADDELPDESPGEELYAAGTTGALEMFALWVGESMPAATVAGATGDLGDGGAEQNGATWGFVMRQLARYRALPGRLRGRLLWQIVQLRADYATHLSYLASLIAKHKHGA